MVRRSCQVMALDRERPLRLSQANSVLRWLVMPQAAISPARQPACPIAWVIACATPAATACGSCSTQPGRGYNRSSGTLP
jgi:hypothetical protein